MLRRLTTVAIVVPLLALGGVGTGAADQRYDAGASAPPPSSAPPAGGGAPGTDDGTTSPDDATNPGTEAPTTPDAPDAAEPSLPEGVTGPFLGTTETELGETATVDGRTVYHFLEDSADPSSATCDGECAQTWPPVLADDGAWLKGIDPDDVGSVQRADGSQQLTLGGWPAYWYAQDQALGDTTGHGVGGTWCAMGPTGAAATPDQSPPGDVGTGGADPSQDPSASGASKNPEPASPAAPAPPAEEPSPSGTGGY